MIRRFTIKNIIIGSVILVVVFGIGLYTNIIKLPITNIISLQYAADFSDDRILMGASHNVFVGKVIKQVGNKSIDDTPKTQFAVEVIHNIKGSLQGTVVVDQTGGYKNGILYLAHGGDVVGPVDPADKGSADTDTLFEVGATYLFATRYSERDNWYTFISHPNGRKLISRDANLDKTKLEALSQNNERVVVLREAYKNEILLDVDVKTNNARNSYKK